MKVLKERGVSAFTFSLHSTYIMNELLPRLNKAILLSDTLSGTTQRRPRKTIMRADINTNETFRRNTEVTNDGP